MSCLEVFQPGTLSLEPLNIDYTNIYHYIICVKKRILAYFQSISPRLRFIPYSFYSNVHISDSIFHISPHLVPPEKYLYLVRIKFKIKGDVEFEIRNATAGLSEL